MATFAGCTILREVKIPESVTIIFESAFADCPNLKGLTISDNVKVVHDMEDYRRNIAKQRKVESTSEVLNCSSGETFMDVDNLDSDPIKGNFISFGDVNK